MPMTTRPGMNLTVAGLGVASVSINMRAMWREDCARSSIRAKLTRANPLAPSIESRLKIGRASCRERVCQYGEISVVAVSLKKKNKKINNTNKVKYNSPDRDNKNTTPDNKHYK